MPAPTISITSVGSLVGSAILDSLEHRRSGLRIIGYNSLADSPNNFRVDEAHLLPPAAEKDAYKRALVARLEQDRPDIVLSGRDEDIGILAELKAAGGVDQVTIVAPSLTVIDILNDKYATYNFANENGLPFARSAIDRAGAERIARDTGFPIMCKVRKGGHASRGVYICRDMDDLDRADRSGNEFLFQEFLARPERIEEKLPNLDFGIPWFFAYAEETQYSVQVLMNENGKPLSTFSAVSHFENGRSLRVETVDDPRLEETGLAYAEALARKGFFGPLSIQVKKLPDGSYAGIELNGRFVGGTYARALLGYREVEFLVDYLLSGTLPPAGPFSDAGTYVVRPPTSILMDRGTVESLQRTGSWPVKPPR